MGLPQLCMPRRTHTKGLNDVRKLYYSYEMKSLLFENDIGASNKVVL
jgi:hypothetical protein